MSVAKDLHDVAEWLGTLHDLHPRPTHLEINLARFAVNEAAKLLENEKLNAAAPAMRDALIDLMKAKPGSSMTSAMAKGWEALKQAGILD